MNETLNELLTIKFWVCVFIVGIIINLISACIPKWYAKIVEKFKMAKSENESEYEKEIQAILGEMNADHDIFIYYNTVVIKTLIWAAIQAVFVIGLTTILIISAKNSDGSYVVMITSCFNGIAIGIIQIRFGKYVANYQEYMEAINRYKKNRLTSR